MANAPRPLRITLLGEGMDLVTEDEVMAHVAQRVSERRRTIVVNHNAHSLALARRIAEMRSLYQRADLIEVDSTPLIFWGRLLGEPIRPEHRCTYLGWRDLFWREAGRRGWRVFLLGGRPGVAQMAAERLAIAAPGASMKAHHGYFDMRPESPALEAVLAQINRFAPDVLLVGMGMPRQEVFIERNHGRLNAYAILPVGAALDYEAGAQTPAPRVLGRLGLEWAFRLAADPARLLPRYLLEPWTLLPAATADLVRRVRGRRTALLT